MTFRSQWSAAFGDALPLGHILRVTHSDRWARFHALPEAKRFATTPSETAEILSRANALAASLFSDGAPIWLARCRFPGGPLEPVATPQYEQFDPATKGLVEVQAEMLNWTPGAFDSDIRAVAADEDRVLFFDPETQRVFAPYEGGFDLFDPDPVRIANRRAQFADWLSRRDDGL